MKKVFVFFCMIMLVETCQANNFYQTNNPFPQTSIQNLNNIYESKPEIIKQEIIKQKKFRFIQRNQESIQNNFQENNEGNNSSFYVFPSH